MTTRFGIAMEKELLKKLDELAKKKGYANRSEAIRDFIREHLVEEEEEMKIDLQQPLIENRVI